MKRATTAVGIVVLLAGVAALALVFFDWNWLKGPLERLVVARTGRELAIDGELRVEIRRRPRVIVENVRISNPPSARHPALFEAQRVVAVVSLPALLRGTLDLIEVELVQPRLALERGDESRRESDPGNGRIRIRQLRVDDGTVIFADAATNTDLTVRIAAAGSTADDDLKLSARGRFRGASLEADGHGPAVLLLADPSKRYPFVANVRAGATSARLRGTVTELASLRALDAALELRGEDLSHLRQLLGISLASTPPYKLGGRLVRAGGVWRFNDFAGRIGDSDVAGRLAFTERPRPHLQLDVVSNRLDFDDLGPLIGAPPRTVGETASAEQRRQARRMRETGQALPDKPFATAAWQHMDVDATLIGKQVLHPPALPIEGLEAKLQIADGVLRLDPLQLRLAGGTAVAQVVLDGRAAPPRGTADIEFRSLRLRELFPTVQAMKTARGFAHGKARLTGTGSSVAAFMSSADGRVSLAVDRGTISNLVLELLGLDVGESVLIFATGDRQIPLHCAVADLDLAKGLATTNVLVLDTADTLVVGAGVVDLRRERLDLTLYPRPKDKSILAARSPLHVRGSLRDPAVRPNVSAMAARGAGAALLALVNPLLALAAFIETGPGRDSDCARLLAEARSGWRVSPLPPGNGR